MVKLLFAGSLILLVAGCRGEAGGPKVSFVETRVDESQSPLPFVIALANSGGATTDVDGIGIEVLGGIVLPGSKAPAGRDDLEVIATDACRVDMLAGHPTEIPARGDGVACGFVTWERSKEAPAAVAVVSARFRVTLADGATVETPPRALLLSSKAGAVGSTIEELTLDRDEAAKLLARVESLSGERTENFDLLVEKLRALAK